MYIGTFDYHFFYNKIIKDERGDSLNIATRALVLTEAVNVFQVVENVSQEVDMRLYQFNIIF